MTKQEEIREGIITNIVRAHPTMLNKNILTLADKILEDEVSQGVVIKTDRKFRSTRMKVNSSFNDYMLGIEDVLAAGYVAVAPLILEASKID